MMVRLRVSPRGGSLFFVSMVATILLLAGCTGEPSTPERAPIVLSGKTTGGNPGLVKVEHSFQIPAGADAVLVAGDFSFSGPASIHVEQPGVRVGCSSNLTRPQDWENDRFQCSWTRGNATWNSDWLLRITASGPAEYTFKMYYVPVE